MLDPLDYFCELEILLGFGNLDFDVVTRTSIFDFK